MAAIRSIIYDRKGKLEMGLLEEKGYLSML